MFINKKEEKKQPLQNNHKHGSRPQYFRNNIDTSISGLPKAAIDQHRPKVKSVRFEDLYDQINNMENTNYDAHLVDAHEENMREDTEEDELFGGFNENTIHE